MRTMFAFVMIAALCAFACPPAQAAGCSTNETDDALRQLPDDMVEAARAAFDLGDQPASFVSESTVWRCQDGKALACFVGANLPCGKIDRRVSLPAVSAWCRAHPGDIVPLVVSGHDTLWQWQCEGRFAKRLGAAWRLDQHGFATELWKPLQTADGAMISHQPGAVPE